MGIKQNLVASTAWASGVLGFPGAVLAADLGVFKAPPAPHVPPYSWAGCYAGLNAGGIWNATSQRVSVPAVPGVAAGHVIDTDGSDPGLIAGAQAGCNYQYSRNLVLGLEGDINYVGSKHGLNSVFDAGAYTGLGNFPLFHNSNGEDSYGAANVVGQTSLRWFSTLRGRLGWAFDRSLVYATGGLAVGDVQSSVSASVQHFDNNSVFLAPFAFNGSYSGWRFGWVLGAGVEQAITDVISAKFEYLHYDLGEVSYLVTGSNGGGNLPATWAASAKTSGDILRVGINFKLCNSTMSGARC